MTFMNTWEIDEAAARYRDHPVLGPATRTLASLRDAADANSDGWAYWPKPSRAAAKLMELIGTTGAYLHDPERASVTEAELRKAMTPIKTFRTTSGLKFTIYEPGEPAALEVETTIVVSVTCKVTAKGRTPDELISNATLDADERITNALSHVHAQGITVEGTTALVNRTALEALFHNDQEN